MILKTKKSLKCMIVLICLTLFAAVGAVMLMFKTTAHAYTASDLPVGDKAIGNLYDSVGGTFLKENLDKLARSVATDNYSNIDELIKDVKNNNKIIRSSDFGEVTVNLGSYRYNNTTYELKWIPVYVSKTKSDVPILTLWLACSNSENDVSAQEKSSFTDGSYNDSSDITPSSNDYGTSMIRAKTLNNGGTYYYNFGTPASPLTPNSENHTATSDGSNKFEIFTTGALKNYIEVPANVGWQAGANFTKNDPKWNGNTNGHYSASAWLNDKVWLPGMYELFDKTTPVSNNNTNLLNYDGGLWGTSVTELSNNDVNYWTRSGNVRDYKAIATVRSDGTLANNSVHTEQGIRPAIHLNLSAVVNKVAIATVTYSATGGTYYYSDMSAAFNMANSATDGATVTMLDDAEVSQRIGVNTSKKVTLDLNGQMLKFTGRNMEIYGEFTLTDIHTDSDKKHTVLDLSTSVSDDTVEITGGVITGGTPSSYGYGNIRVMSGGKFTMQGGTLAGNNGDSIVELNDGGEFAMESGVICNNSATYGGVYAVGGTFTMSGNAEIRNNKSVYGGGVYVENGTFTVRGSAKITGNNATSMGGGVYVKSGGTINVTGVPQIIGNTKGEGTYANNVYLESGMLINVTGSLTGVTTQAQIGVTLQAGVGQVTDGYSVYNNRLSPDRCFKADNENYMLGLERNNVIIAAPVATLAIGETVTKYVLVQDAFKAANDQEAKATVTLIGDVQLSSGNLTVETNITLNLNDRVLKGTGNGSVITVKNNAIFTLKDELEDESAVKTEHAIVNPVDGGEATVVGGVITGGRYSTSSGTGGGVYNLGSFIMEGGTIAGNTTDTSTIRRGGGGVYNSGTFNMGGGTISHNLALNGGGVNNESRLYVYGTAQICDNLATLYGGGVRSSSWFDIRGTAKICHNEAVKGGGGIYIHNGANEKTLTMNDDVEISNNVVRSEEDGCGGGMYIGCGSITISGGKIVGNTATHGGGMYINTVNGGNMISMTGGVIGGTAAADKNSAENGGGVYIEYGSFRIASSAKIIGNTAKNNGGGVYCNNVFDVYNGATISGNVAESGFGGGVYVADVTDASGAVTTPAQFTLVAGVIGGTAAADKNTAVNGGGVYFESGTFKLSGVVTAVGNKKIVKGDDNRTSEAASNVYLANGQKITVTNMLRRNADASQIGITLADYSSAFTVDYGRYNTSGKVITPSNYFSADDAALTCMYLDTDNEVCIGTHTGGTATCLAQAECEHCGNGYGDVGAHTFEVGEHDVVCSTCTNKAVAATSDFEGNNIGYHIAFDDAWNAVGEIEGGHLALLANVFIDSTLVVGNDKNMSLHLNGYKIELTGASGSVIEVKGALELNNDVPNCLYSLNTYRNTSDHTVDGQTVSGGIITGGKGSSLGGEGGGIKVLNGSLTLSEATIAGNAATCGGGVFIGGGTFTMNGGSICNNTSRQSGGGVYVSSGTFTMNGGEISRNSAVSHNGGGVCNFGTFNMSGGAVISYNTAGGDGGGVDTATGAAFNITGGTISHNTANGNGGGVYVSTAILGGGFMFDERVADIKMSGLITITNNKKVVIGDGNETSDVASNFYLGAYNVIKITGALAADSRIGITLERDNDAFTSGYGSFNDEYPQTYFISDDESLVPVLIKKECKLVASAVSVTVVIDDRTVVTRYGDICEAWTYANAVGTSSDNRAKIMLYGNVQTGNTLTVDTGAYITLDLNGYMLEFTGESGAVIVVNGTFTLDDNKTDPDRNTDPHTITSIVTSQPVVIEGGLITGGKGENGGGVYVDGGTFTMTGGTVSGNTAYYGGGVYVSGGTFTMTGGKVSDNKATYDVGGVDAQHSTLNISGAAEISGNTANSVGGIYGYDTTLNMTGGTVSGNVASSLFGGVYIDGGKFNVSGAIIIADNKIGETACNVYIDDTPITVVGALKDSNGNVAKIGITLKDGAGTFANGYGSNNKDAKGNIILPCTYFTSDAGGCVRLEANERAAVASAHEYDDDYTIDKAATCTDSGKKSIHCKYCDGIKDEETIASLGHDHQAVVTAPTCTEAGYTTHKCSRCGDSYTDSPVAATGHTTRHYSAKAPTCTEVGWNEYDACDKCDYTTKQEIRATGHTLNSVAQQNKTCTTDGVLAHDHCSVCNKDFINNEEKTAAQLKIPAGHTEVDISATAPTCTESGLTAGRVCSVCHTVTVAQEQVAALGHDYGEWVVSKAATIYEFGEEKRICAHDNTHTETRQIPKRVSQLVNADGNGGDNSVEITAPDGFAYNIELVVTEIAKENYGEYDSVAQAANGRIDFVYDVTLKSDGVSVQPDGMLTIKLLIPTELRGKNFKLFHLHGNDATDMEYTVDGSYAVVTTDRLSEFVFVGEKPKAPESSGETLWLILIIIVSLLIVGEVGFIAYRKVRRSKAKEGIQ